MISHKISSLSGLLIEAREITNDYCRRYRIPQLPVVLGTMEPDSLAEFNFKRMQLLISPKLLDFIQSEANKNKVWVLFDVIRHELRHYEQYRYLKLSKRRIMKTQFDENEAVIVGRLWADGRINKLTPSQINPLATLGTSLVTGVGLGAGLIAGRKVIDKIWKNPVQVRKRAKGYSVVGTDSIQQRYINEIQREYLGRTTNPRSKSLHSMKPSLKSLAILGAIGAGIWYLAKKV